MVETFQEKLSNSPVWRWAAPVLLASTILSAYTFADVLSPLQGFLQTQHGWDLITYSRFAGSEPFLKVFVFFLIFVDIILDKMGIHFAAIPSSAIMAVGASINCYALTEGFEASSLKMWFDNNLNLSLSAWNITSLYDNMSISAKLSTIEFMIFSCDAEMADITVSCGIVKQFEGKEMALAIGIEMVIARIGVTVVVIASPATASIHPVDVSRPVAYELLLLVIGLICFIVYDFMDKKLDAQDVEEEKGNLFKVSDIRRMLLLEMFWIMALPCVFYYSAIFPFQKCAINMLQCNPNFTAGQAGMVFFVFPLGTAAVTPFLGNFLNRKGEGTSMLILGTMLMVIYCLVFTFVVSTTQSAITTYATIILLGIPFLLVPATLWLSVPKLIGDELIGSAYALIFWTQNIGLYAFPVIIGSVLRSSNPGVTDPLKYNYTVPMLVFASLSVITLILGFLLKALDKKKGYGSEQPNIQKQA